MLEVPKAAKSTGDRRRDLNNYERSLLALKIKPDIAKKAKEKETERKTTYQKSEKSSLPTVNTTKEVAKLAGVSHDTIAKVEKIEKQATPEVKAAVKSGKISINEGYQQIKRAEKICAAYDFYLNGSRQKMSAMTCDNAYLRRLAPTG